MHETKSALALVQLGRGTPRSSKMPSTKLKSADSTTPLRLEKARASPSLAHPFPPGPLQHPSQLGLYPLQEASPHRIDEPISAKRVLLDQMCRRRKCHRMNAPDNSRLLQGEQERAPTSAFLITIKISVPLKQPRLFVKPLLSSLSPERFVPQFQFVALPQEYCVLTESRIFSERGVTNRRPLRSIEYRSHVLSGAFEPLLAAELKLGSASTLR